MKHFLKLYMKVCLLILLLFFMLGGVCPALISSDSTCLLVVGVVLMMTIPPGVCIFAYHEWKKTQLLMKEETNEKTSTPRRPRSY